MKLFLSVFAFICCFACGNNNPAPAVTEPGKDSTQAAQNYFPVMDFLKSEIAAVDSMPVGIMKYKTVDKKTDSGYIQHEEFRRLAIEFVPPALTDSIFRHEFKESSFLDKSTGNATFFYSTANNNIDLKRIDVVTEKTDTYDKVKSIYIEKSYASADSLVIKKLFWKPERNFQVITQVTKNAGDPKTELIKVVWDNRE